MLKSLIYFKVKYINERFDFMKMLAFGKNCGSFENDNGEVIEYYKISAVKLAEYVKQTNDGVNIQVGGECGKYSCTSNVFKSLPDDPVDYAAGLLLNVDFDDKKKIVEVDLAD